MEEYLETIKLLQKSDQDDKINIIDSTYCI